MSTSWQLKKWCRIPKNDLAFLIWVANSASSLSSRQMSDPRYLNYSVKWMHFSFGRLMLLGAVFTLLYLLAFLMEVGKNIGFFEVVYDGCSCFFRMFFVIIEEETVIDIEWFVEVEIFVAGGWSIRHPLRDSRLTFLCSGK